MTEITILPKRMKCSDALEFIQVSSYHAEYISKHSRFNGEKAVKQQYIKVNLDFSPLKEQMFLPSVL